MKLTIGMRYIKTAVAVTLCILISRALNSEYPFFAAIAAVISMENTVTSSFITGKNRMMGTVVGAAIGLIFVLIRPENALMCGLGVIVIILVCNRMQWLNSISIATIVFLAIMLNLDGQDPLLYSVNRIADTLLGITVALVVNYLLFPYDIARHLVEGEQVLKAKALQIIRNRFCLNTAADLDDLLQEIIRMEAQNDLYTREFRIGKKEEHQILQIQEKLVVYRDLYAHLKMLVRLDGEPCLDPDNVSRINQLGCEQVPEGCVIEDDLNTVFNYHVGKILDDLQTVSE